MPNVDGRKTSTANPKLRDTISSSPGVNHGRMRRTSAGTCSRRIICDTDDRAASQRGVCLYRGHITLLRPGNRVPDALQVLIFRFRSAALGMNGQTTLCVE